ncbi:MAG: hypothetical protein K8S87_03905 [Planctomycetes bacterium]|nr:hypothetical protein [Planctomycetota bacterium]
MRKVVFFAIFLCFAFFSVNAQIVEDSARLQVEKPNKSKAIEEKIDYLIITTDSLRKSAQKYAKYRRKTGFKTQIFTVAECLTKFPEENAGNAVQQVILEYRSRVGVGSSDKIDANPSKLPKNYKCPNFYVLLLGDITPVGQKFDPKTHIPGFYKKFKTDPGITGPGTYENVPSDNSYACRPQDDDVPTIPVGRLTFTKEKEVEEYLEAVEKYENQTIGGLWRRRINIFAGDPRFEGVPKFVSNLIENFFKTGVINNLAPEYEGTFTYANVNSPYAFAPSKYNEKLISEINKGSLILNYIGHGWKTSVDRLHFRNKKYTVFTVKDAAKIDCKGKFPIAAFFTCYTGCYDMDKPSLAETLLANPKGPIGVIASSRISAEANYLLETAFFRAATIDKAETLGKLFLRTKRRMLTLKMPMAQMIKRMKLKISALEGYAVGKRSHLWLYNLFGDPALKIPHPELKCEIKIEKDSVAQGAQINAFINCDSENGEILATFECKLADFLEKPRLIDINDKDFEKKAIKNHEIANKKVIVKRVVKLVGGKAEVTFKIPNTLKPRKYIIRAIVVDENKTGFTSAEFTVTEKD